MATETFDDLQKQYDALTKRMAKTQAQLRELSAQMDKERRSLTIECHNGHSNIVGSLELIHETYRSERECGSDNWTSYSRYLWVCPTCTVVAEPPKSDPRFPNGLSGLVKAVHEWDSEQGGSPYGRAAELLGPHLKRKREAEAKVMRDYDLEQARRLLRANGELK